jgi:hypothetical protein
MHSESKTVFLPEAEKTSDVVIIGNKTIQIPEVIQPELRKEIEKLAEEAGWTVEKTPQTLPKGSELMEAEEIRSRLIEEVNALEKRVEDVSELLPKEKVRMVSRHAAKRRKAKRKDQKAARRKNRK